MSAIPDRFSDYTPQEATIIGQGLSEKKPHEGRFVRGRALAVVTPLALAAQAIFNPTAAAATDNCQFILGFKTIHDALPAIVGDCLDNQAFAANGDALQHTTGGLLAWRKTDNWTAFTDGYRTWVNGPNGIQQRLNTERFPWENDGQTPAPGPDTKPSSIPNPDAPVIYLPNPAPDFGKIKRTTYYVIPGGVMSAEQRIPDGDGAPLPKGTSFVAVFDGTSSIRQYYGLLPGFNTEKINFIYLVSPDRKLTAIYITKDGSTLPAKANFKQGDVIAQVGDPMLSGQGSSLVFRLNTGNPDEIPSSLMSKVIYG